MTLSDFQEHLKAARLLRPCLRTSSAELIGQIAITVTFIYLASRPNFSISILGELGMFVVIWRWFAILHTVAHRAYFKSSLANDLVGLLASIFALLPYYPWKASHLAHHRWTGWYRLDPSLDFPRRSMAPESMKRTMDISWRYHLPFFSLFLILGKLWKQTERPADDSLRRATDPSPSPGALPFCLSLLAIVGGHALLLTALGARGYAQAFALPVLAYLIASDAVLLNQHSEFPLRTPPADAAPKPLHPLAHLHYTRSVLLPEAVSRHVFLRFDWHELHHLYPNVPHYSLPSLRSAVGRLPNELNARDWFQAANKTQGHHLALPVTEADTAMSAASDLEKR